jgi:hypothetical protein
MDEDIKALERALRSRKAELQRLILQMRSDHLNSGSVFRILNNELRSIEEKLKNPSQPSSK